MERKITMSSILFTAWGYEVSILEFIAAITSFVGVWLGTTGKRITWPWWATGSILYAVFFYQVELFASAALQIIFIVAAIYGWRGWGPKGAKPGVLSTRKRLYIGVGVIASVAVLSPVLSGIGAAATWSDAFILVGSLFAQVMMIYEKFEAWFLWLIINIVGSTQYLLLGYWFTAMLYVMFTAVAIIGWRRWQRALSN
jgi:nicotinamide mononucleotide transporter